MLRATMCLRGDGGVPEHLGGTRTDRETKVRCRSSDHQLGHPCSLQQATLQDEVRLGKS